MVKEEKRECLVLGDKCKQDNKFPCIRCSVISTPITGRPPEYKKVKQDE